jgi:predicted CDP-diglyceride synthetase/phosphatidate cytidylyltransferase
MPEKDPASYALATYLWVVILAAAGGAVNFLRKIKSGTARAFNITEFIGELMTSGFAGLLTFWLCEAADVNKLLSAVLIGISGHMGSRAIFKIEKWAEDKFGAAK